MSFPNEASRRHYWAERRRRQNQWRGKRAQQTQNKQPYETVLLATSLTEFNELRRQYPDMKITLQQEQLSLLDK